MDVSRNLLIDIGTVKIYLDQPCDECKSKGEYYDEWHGMVTCHICYGKGFVLTRVGRELKLFFDRWCK